MAAILLVAVAAGGYFLWNWRQYSRPGMRHYLQGMEYVEASSFSSAEREWLLGVQEDPTFPGCYDRLGDLYTSLLRFPDAVRYYEKACQYSPADGELWMKLAKMYRKMDNDDKSLQAAARAAQLLPDHLEAQGEFGILAVARQNTGAAMKALSRAHELSPDNSRYLTALAALQLDGDDIATAERTLTPFLSRHPDDAEACFLMAEVYNHKPRTPENLRLAIKYAEHSLAKNPNHYRVYPVLGQLYLDARQTEKALRVFQRGMPLTTNKAPLYSGMMQCYARLGDTAKHRQVAAILQKLIARLDRKLRLQHALGFNKADVHVALKLARIFEEEQDYQKAQDTYRHALRYAPRNARVLRARDAFYRRLNAVMASQQKKAAAAKPAKAQ